MLFNSNSIIIIIIIIFVTLTEWLTTIIIILKELGASSIQEFTINHSLLECLYNRVDN